MVPEPPSSPVVPTPERRATPPEHDATTSPLTIEGVDADVRRALVALRLELESTRAALDRLAGALAPEGELRARA